MCSARGPGMNHLGSFEPGALDTPSQSPAILVVAGARRFRAPPPLSAERPRIPSNHWSASPQVRKSVSLQVCKSHNSRRPVSGLRILNSELGTFGLSDVRTFGLSDVRTFGLSDFRTFGLSDFRTFGLSDFRTFGLSDRWPLPANRICQPRSAASS